MSQKENFDKTVLKWKFSSVSGRQAICYSSNFQNFVFESQSQVYLVTIALFKIVKNYI